MAMNDMRLHLEAYPDGVTTAAMDDAIAFAYGRAASVRDFIWGGAPEHLLRTSVAPLLVSH